LSNTLQWSGTIPTCDLPTTACYSSPCLHGGICSSLTLSSYTCDCSLTDYYGATCQTGLISEDVALIYPFSGQTNIASNPFYFRWVISISNLPVNTPIAITVTIASKDLLGSHLTINLFDHDNWRQWLLGQLNANPALYPSHCLCPSICFPSQNVFFSRTGTCSVTTSGAVSAGARKVYIAIENLDVAYDHIEYTITTGPGISSGAAIVPQILLSVALIFALML